jgi:hypothetical protein
MKESLPGNQGAIFLARDWYVTRVDTRRKKARGIPHCIPFAFSQGQRDDVVAGGSV